MLVDSMTFEEVEKEVLSEYDAMLKIAAYRRKEISRFVKRQQKFPCTYLMEWNSPHKNKWLLVYIAFRRNIEKGVSVMGGCIQKYPKGYAYHQTAINVYGDAYVTTYLPHFFDRYAERMGVSLTGTTLIKYFVKRNNIADNDWTEELSGKNSRNGNSFHMCFQEGIGMGERVSEKHIILKTFITYDMTTSEQNEVFTNNKVEVEDYESMHKKAWEASQKHIINTK